MFAFLCYLRRHGECVIRTKRYAARGSFVKQLRYFRYPSPRLYAFALNLPPFALFWFAPLPPIVVNTRRDDLVVVDFDRNIGALRLRYGSNYVPAYGHMRVSLYPSFWNVVLEPVVSS